MSALTLKSIHSSPFLGPLTALASVGNFAPFGVATLRSVVTVDLEPITDT